MTIPPRYVEEDVPMGLVAFASLGQRFGVPTPVINLVIDWANLLKETDYRQTGRTVERLGLSDISPAQLLETISQ
jgi:opine dehydrogenase